MHNRDSQSIAAAIEHLEKHQEFREVKTVEIGVGKAKQRVVTMNGTIITAFDENGEPILPLTDAQKLRKLAKEVLHLSESDSVNTQATITYHLKTLLIQATIENEHHIIKVLLDHGADPSIADSEGNNAFMHAAKNGFSDLLREFMSLIQADHKASEQDKRTLKGEQQQEEATKTQGSEAKVDSNSHSTAPAAKASRAQNEKLALRVRLDPSVLMQKNRLHQTAEELALDYKEKNSLRAEVEEEKNPKPKPKPPAPAEKSAKSAQKVLDNFKALIDDLDNLKPNKVVTDKSQLMMMPAIEPVSQARTEANEAAELITLNRAIEEKYTKIRHHYDGFYVKQLGFFARKTREAAAKNEAQRKARAEREILRHQHGLILLSLDETPELETLQILSEAHNFEPILVKVGEQYSIYGCKSTEWELTPLEDFQADFLKENQNLQQQFARLPLGTSQFLAPAHVLLAGEQPGIDPKPAWTRLLDLGHKPLLNFDKKHDYGIPERKGQPVLPVSSQDQAMVKAALSLLKDYYAPASAPLPHFLELGALRRLLTFHMGRRYCEHAEKLYKTLSAASLNEVTDLMKITRTIESALHAVQLITHDGNNKNTLFNSSYTRRLDYILNTLKNTAAYQQTAQNLSPDTYLDIFDIKYGI
jgi:hypothetical protein